MIYVKKKEKDNFNVTRRKAEEIRGGKRYSQYKRSLSIR